MSTTVALGRRRRNEPAGWALDQAEPFVDGTLDVVVNGRSLAHHIRQEDIVAAVRARGGAMGAFGPFQQCVGAALIARGVAPDQVIE